VQTPEGGAHVPGAALQAQCSYWHRPCSAAHAALQSLTLAVARVSLICRKFRVGPARAPPSACLSSRPVPPPRISPSYVLIGSSSSLIAKLPAP
jgi:hypothetical protein